MLLTVNMHGALCLCSVDTAVYSALETVGCALVFHTFEERMYIFALTPAVENKKFEENICIICGNISLLNDAEHVPVHLAHAAWRHTIVSSLRVECLSAARLHCGNAHA